MIKDKSPKILFIKQAQAPDLYTKNTNNIKELIKSSRFRSGPLALFHELNTDFLIVNEHKTSECKIWKEGTFFGESTYKNITKQYLFAKSIRNEITKIQNIKWEKYDIVISLNVSIPSKIIKRHKNILWCYYLIDPCPSFILSKRNPFFRYNVFLNQNLDDNALNQEAITKFKKYHKVSINFPYALLSSKTLTDIYPAKNKSGCHIEPRSYRKNMTKKLQKKLELYGAVSYLPKLPKIITLPEYLERLCQRKYFLIIPTNIGLFRGNALLEANSAGCLILAPSYIRTINRAMILDECYYKTEKEMISLIETLENDKKLFKQLLHKQQIQNNKLSYQGPIDTLFKLKELQIKNKLTLNKRTKARTIDFIFYLIFIFNFFFTIRLYKVIRIIIKKIFKKSPEELISKIFNRKGKLF